MKRERPRQAAIRWGLVLFVVTSLPLDWADLPAFAQSSAKVSPIIEIPMELLFRRPQLRGTINGEGPIAMIIDPQLPTTLISRPLANRLNLKEARGSSGIEQTIADFGFGPHKFPQVPVEVRDIAPLIPELGPGSQPAAVLALTLWGDQLVTLDYARFQVRVEAGALPDPNGRDVYALAPQSNDLRVNIAIGGRSIESRIDLLFPRAVLLPQSYLTELPLAGKVTEGTPVRTREATVKVREARLADRLTLAGVEVTPPLVLFGDVDRATVGYGALARLSITYDLTRGRARLNRRQ
jgi:hypothetical protein